MGGCTAITPLADEIAESGAAGRGIRRLYRRAVLSGAGLGRGGDGLCLARLRGESWRSGVVERLHFGPGAGGDCQPWRGPVFVEVTEDLTIDFAHLEAQAKATGAKVLLLSHMRGHVCDMEALVALCDRLGLRVIEDCAHTMGAKWKGVPSGRHGAIGCYSTQTYKHMNSGEGGLLVTDDEELAARAVLLSGSYMLYARHRAAPGTEVFERLKAGYSQYFQPDGQSARGDPAATDRDAG
jgi:hypothetical protein